jgi:hypothetical protein
VLFYDLDFVTQRAKKMCDTSFMCFCACQNSQGALARKWSRGATVIKLCSIEFSEFRWHVRGERERERETETETERKLDRWIDKYIYIERERERGEAHIERQREDRHTCVYNGLCICEHPLPRTTVEDNRVSSGRTDTGAVLSA